MGETTILAPLMPAAKAKVTMRETGDLLMDTIQENPIPTAMVGIGVGWLLFDAFAKQQKRNSLKDDGYSNTDYGNAPGTAYSAYVANHSTESPNSIPAVASKASDKLHETSDKISDAISDAKSKASDTVHQLQDKASDLVGTAQGKASEWGNTAQSTARKAVSTTQDFITENPLAAGAIALLAGAVIGLALPATSQENRLLGEHRDKLVDQANLATQDVLGKVKTVADEALAVAKSSLADAKDNIQTTVQNQVYEQELVPA